jgi:peroxiredoxin
MEQHYLSIGAYAPDFELPGVDDQVHHLASYFDRHKAIGLVFLAHDCDATAEVLDQLKAMQAVCGTAFTWIAINASPEDDLAHMKTYTADLGLTFPYLRDDTQDVARTLGASCTPEVFLIDQSWALRYRGSLAGDAGRACRVALSQLLAGEPIDAPTEPDRNSSSPSIGTAIRWRHSTEGLAS